MISIIDIGWLAGIVEGEGCITWNGTPRVVVKMTDKDAVDRFGRLLDSPVHPERRRTPSGKTMWSSAACGQKAIGLCMTLYPQLGERRKQKIRSILATWKQFRGRRASYRKSSATWKPNQ